MLLASYTFSRTISLNNSAAIITSLGLLLSVELLLYVRYLFFKRLFSQPPSSWLHFDQLPHAMMLIVLT